MTYIGWQVTKEKVVDVSSRENIRSLVAVIIHDKGGLQSMPEELVGNRNGVSDPNKSDKDWKHP